MRSWPTVYLSWVVHHCHSVCIMDIAGLPDSWWPRHCSSFCTSSSCFQISCSQSRCARGAHSDFRRDRQILKSPSFIPSHFKPFSQVYQNFPVCWTMCEELSMFIRHFYPVAVFGLWTSSFYQGGLMKSLRQPLRLSNTNHCGRLIQQRRKAAGCWQSFSTSEAMVWNRAATIYRYRDTSRW